MIGSLTAPSLNYGQSASSPSGSRFVLVSRALRAQTTNGSDTEVEMSIPVEHPYATAAERCGSWSAEKIAGKFSRKNTEVKS
jgi:hypothetical protein